MEPEREQPRRSSVTNRHVTRDRDGARERAQLQRAETPESENDMNPAQAARQTPSEEPAANINVGRGEPMREAGSNRDVDRDDEEEHAELEESDYEEDEFDEERDIERMTIRVLSRARERIREQPLTAATGAFIVGFALGNGVPKFLARAGIAIGLRMVMQRMFERAEMYEHDA